MASSAEDRGVSNMGKMAVTPQSQSIDSEVIDMALAASNPTNSLKSKVTLTFSAENLPNLDKSSKTDPILVIWQENNNNHIYLGQTEAQQDTLSPQWVTSIDVDYFFEQSQTMVVKVFDVDDAT